MLRTTRHFLERLSERDIGWEEIQRAVECGAARETRTGRRVFRFEGLVVVTTGNDRLLTVYRKGETNGSTE